MWGAIASAAASLAGSGIQAWTQHNAANREYEHQKEFAQNGISWRVADAKRAGIHPIFAIGANTPTYSPQAAVGTDFGLSAAGQNIGRAIEAGQTARQRKAAQDTANEVGQAQADYYRALTERAKMETDLMGQRSVLDALNDIRGDTVGSMAAGSERQIRTQQNGPAMQPVNGNKGFAEGTPRYEFEYGLNGERVAISHSQPMHDKWEDMFLAEYWPVVLGFVADARYKLTREPIRDRNGLWYAWNGGFYAPVDIKSYRHEWEQSIINRMRHPSKYNPYRAGAGLRRSGGGSGV